ncbi:MAG: prohibitin family protein [Candidatus Hydrogenedens sp.]|nr:prohibitin family protein [Candidatus Hydrogenedens sp.]
MKTLARITLLVLLSASAVSVSGCIPMPYRTGPNEVGVRTIKMSLTGAKGVEEKVYEPGTTHWFIPFFTDWHTFDTSVQNLQMLGSLNRGDRTGRDELVFKTIDGNDISLDVIVSYKLIEEKAPMVLQEVATNSDELRESIVRTIARSKPRDIFGELDTEDFYIAGNRTAKSQEVLEALNAILIPYGVEVSRVGTVDYRYSPEYQTAIEDKKVAEQEAEKLKSETKAVAAQFLTEVEKAKAENEKLRAEADGDYRRAVIEADAYFEQQKSLAKAILAEGKAEAEAIKEMNAALSGQGGEAMVKLKIAESLKDKRILMLPTGGGGLDVRNTDVNQLLQLLGVQELGKK